MTEYRAEQAVRQVAAACDLWKWYYAMTELHDRLLWGYFREAKDWTSLPYPLASTFSDDCQRIIEQFRDDFGISTWRWTLARTLVLQGFDATHH